MSLYDYRYVSVSLSSDPRFGRLTPYEVMVALYAGLRADKRRFLPHDAAMLKGQIFPTRPSENVGAIARARDVLLSVGVFIRRSRNGIDWIEVTNAVLAEQGREFTYADSSDENSVQPELKLGPLGVAPEAAPPFREKPRRRLKESKEEKKQNESRGDAGGTRAMSRGEDSDSRKREAGRFAVARDAIDDPAWRRIYDALGAVEMQRSGMAWWARLVYCSETVNTIASDLEGAEGVVNRAAAAQVAWDASAAGRRMAEQKRRRA